MEKFGELLSETMNEIMRQVFGESATEFIYRLMERHVSLKREEIAEKIETFYAYLEKLLGSEGAQIIQATSLRCLCLKLRREYEEVEMYFSFLDELYELKFELLILPLERGGKYEKTRKGDIPVLEDTTEDFDRIMALKENRFFKRLINKYLQHVAVSDESDWSTISDAIQNFESALQQSAPFKRNKKFEDAEKQVFFDRMKLWYKRTLSVRTWFDLSLHDAIYKTLKEK